MCHNGECHLGWLGTASQAACSGTGAQVRSPAREITPFASPRAKSPPAPHDGKGWWLSELWGWSQCPDCFNKSLFGKGSFLIGGKCHCPWSSSASDLASACSHRLLPPVQSPVLLGFSLHIQRFLLSLPHSPMCDPSLSLISLPVHPCPAP